MNFTIFFFVLGVTPSGDQGCLLVLQSVIPGGFKKTYVVLGIEPGQLYIRQDYLIRCIILLVYSICTISIVYAKYD